MSEEILELLKQLQEDVQQLREETRESLDQLSGKVDEINLPSGSGFSEFES